jgi:hypothetical protein
VSAPALPYGAGRLADLLKEARLSLTGVTYEGWSEECPFPAIDHNGGQLVRWGIQGGGRWAEYRPVLTIPQCYFCEKPVTTWKGEGGDALCAAITVAGMKWAHLLCRTKAKGLTVSAMATAQITKELPACRLCGRPWENHNRQIGTIWGAQCNTDEEQWWQPVTPFRSRNWPYRLIAGWDYERDQVIYADEPMSAKEAA